MYSCAGRVLIQAATRSNASTSSCNAPLCPHIGSTPPFRLPAMGPAALALMAIFNATGGPGGWGGRVGKRGWGGEGSPCAWAGVCCAANATEWGCHGAEGQQLGGLNLGYNQLSGTLPEDPAVWGALPHLRSLSMRSNALSGTLPTALRLLTALEDLNLRHNRISGTLPLGWGPLQRLAHFSMLGNRLSGSIPASFGSLRRLGAGPHGGLDLTSNRFRGGIPATLSKMRSFHSIPWSSGGNIGLGGGGDGNLYACPVPPITLTNGTVTTTYARCGGQLGAGGSFDVVVYGATSGGVIAAVAAARAGHSVALLDPGSRIGGMSAGGLSSTDRGSAQVIGGMAGEFYRENGRHYNESKAEYMLEPHVALEIFQQLVAEANVSLFSHAPVETVAKAEAQLTSLTTVDGRIFTAPVFIEADYEGDLMARAGVSYAVGREANTTYNESLNGVRVSNEGHEFALAVDPFDASGTPLPMVNAFDPLVSVPGQGDKKVQAYNFRLCVSTDPDNRVPFKKPAGYDPSYWELARRYFTTPEVSRCVRAPSGNVAGCIKNEDTGEWHQPEPVDDGGAAAYATAQGTAGGRDHRGADLNNGGPISTDFVGGSWLFPEANYTQRAEIVKAHKLYTQSFLWFMSTDPALNQSIRASFQKFGLCKDEFVETDHWPPSLYVRAARRLLGERVFNQNTPKLQRNWDNLSIGCGSYNFDSHTAERLACSNSTVCGDGPKHGTVGPGTSFAWMEGDVETGPGIYDIPMWVLLPKRAEATNLLVVASPSASHIGMSTLRMEPQFMIMGQSAGVIASLALKAAAAAAAAERTVIESERAIDRASGQVLVHDVDPALLHAELLKGGQLMGAACDIPPPPGPPRPPPPHAAAWTVEGAGTTSCNGVYKYDPTEHRDYGTAFYTKDSAHQLYRANGVWRIAHGLATPNFLWYTSAEGGMSPPVSGWQTKASYKGVAPLPRLTNGTTQQ